jgi:RHS repeat-associated protein
MLSAFTFNDRLQLSTLKYTLSGVDKFKLTYNYAVSTNNNGQIQQVLDYVIGNRAVTYTYDPLGRLKTALTPNSGVGSTTPDTFNVVWSYDRYGNRKIQTSQGGSLAVTQPTLSIDALTNRITNSGFTYDAAGNLLTDGINTIAYDAENRPKTVNGAAGPTYDGAGLKLKTASTLYVYAGAKVIAEYPAASTTPAAPTKEYVYDPGAQLLVTISGGTGGSGGTVKYHYSDHLSTRFESDASGIVTRAFGHLPFGDHLYEYGATGTSNWKFTSYERDSSTGLDYAIFRNMSWRYGRFMQADRLGGGIVEPQTLNRYAYVASDPINSIDPLGLDDGILIDSNLFGCRIDGAPISCSFASSLSAVGVARVCPFASCDFLRFTQDGLIYSQKYVSDGWGLIDEKGCTDSIHDGTANGSTCHFGFHGHFEWELVADPLKGLSDFSAGAGDWLSFGLTDLARDWQGTNSVVNKASGSYVSGVVVGAAIQSTITAGGSAAARAVDAGKQSWIYGKAGFGGVLNSGSVRFGWAWNGSRNYIGLRIGEGASTLHIPIWTLGLGGH